MCSCEGVNYKNCFENKKIAQTAVDWKLSKQEGKDKNRQLSLKGEKNKHSYILFVVLSSHTVVKLDKLTLINGM